MVAVCYSFWYTLIRVTGGAGGAAEVKGFLGGRAKF